MDRVIELVNEAPLSSERVEPEDGRLVLVLFREDGLQYDLLQGDGGLVGLAEGDRGYLGALQSPELAALLADLARSGQSRSEAALVLSRIDHLGVSRRRPRPGHRPLR